MDVPSGSDDPQTLAHDIESTYINDGPTGARLGAIYRKYSEVQAKLAMANMKLVAHVARRFRDRGNRTNREDRHDAVQVVMKHVPLDADDCKVRLGVGSSSIFPIIS